jgi:uncharacterized membrane protein YfcA
MIFLGIPGTVANATNRIAILPQNITAVFTFFKKGFSNFKLSLTLAICAIPGAIVGAKVAANIANDQFNSLLAIIMLLVLVVMAIPQKKTISHDNEPSKFRLILGHICMVFIGFWGGFIQIGVGFLLIPALNRVMQFDLVTTNMHKVFIVMCYTVAALFVFASELELIWKYGIALAIGTVIGAWLATTFQIQKGAGAIKWVLNLVIIAFIIKLLFFS